MTILQKKVIYVHYLFVLLSLVCYTALGEIYCSGNCIACPLRKFFIIFIRLHQTASRKWKNYCYLLFAYDGENRKFSRFGPIYTALRDFPKVLIFQNHCVFGYIYLRWVFVLLFIHLESCLDIPMNIFTSSNRKLYEI